MLIRSIRWGQTACAVLALSLAAAAVHSQGRPQPAPSQTPAPKITPDTPAKKWLWCQLAMAQAQSAKEQWALDHHKAQGTVPTTADLVGAHGYLTGMPTCPDGGTILFGKVGELPRCSIHGPLTEKYHFKP